LLIFGKASRTLDVLLLASGLITAIPLLCFGEAARRLPLSTLGFLQYMAPTIQFMLAIFVFGESFQWEKQVSFALVWAALIVLTTDSLVLARRPSPPRLSPNTVPLEASPVACPE
jgi:chloramphenicol-sensitive protein RarD